MDKSKNNDTKRYAAVNVMIGPPSTYEKLNNIMSSFFGADGAHTICGGTTALLAAEYLGTDIKVSLEYIDCAIPPSGEMDGVDLVTEGVITLGLVLDHANRLLNGGDAIYRSQLKTDAVSVICRMLFDDAEKIRFFIGMAVNKAHQKLGSGINFEHKLNILSDLSDRLCQMGKNVTIRYY